VRDNAFLFQVVYFPVEGIFIKGMVIEGLQQVTQLLFGEGFAIQERLLKQV
jgi:hypothetical protein